MVCLLWIQHLIDILCGFVQLFKQYCYIVDRVLTAHDCICAAIEISKRQISSHAQRQNNACSRRYSTVLRIWEQATRQKGGLAFDKELYIFTSKCWFIVFYFILPLLAFCASFYTIPIQCVCNPILFCCGYSTHATVWFNMKLLSFLCCRMWLECP